MSVITHKFPRIEIKKSKTKLCIICNKKAACFGPKDTNKYEYCRDCKLEDMIDIRHKTCICNFEKCDKRASYGFSDKKPERCYDHKTCDMIDLSHKKKCEFSGCTLRPHFGIVGENPRFCSTHKLEGMEDIVNKKCIFKDCKKITPNFNYPSEKIGIYCSFHKLEGMINVRKNNTTNKVKSEKTKVKRKKCEFSGCTLRPHFGIIGEKSRFCSTHKLEGMENNVNKKCIFKDCKKITPNFNYPSEKVGIYCTEHKLEGMINVKNKNLCKICSKPNSIYNLPGYSPEYCKKHKTPEMINVISKKCKFIGCTKIPSYGLTKNKPEYCFTHKEKGMIEKNRKKCVHENCPKRPFFNYKNESIPLYCSTHKLKDMIDIKNKRCKFKGCTKITPNFNFKGQKYGIYCSTHKLEGMINVKHKSCEYESCIKFVLYGKPGLKPSRCAEHREKGMIKRPNGKCKVCKIPAVYGKNYINLHCEEHKEEGEINMVENECISCGLTMILDKDNRCEYCNPETFKIATLAKQKALMDFLDSKKLTGISTDKMIDGGVCGKERPDRIYDFGDKIIVLECDEHQHRDRICLCEQTRMINIRH